MKNDVILKRFPMFFFPFLIINYHKRIYFFNIICKVRWESKHLDDDKLVKRT